MDAFTKALQPVKDPNFVDSAFKTNPEGAAFKEWQPVDGMLVSAGRQLEYDDVRNHGGSSQGSQTAMDSDHRRMLSAGQGDTNNGSNYTGSTNDMQDVNSALQGPSRMNGTSASRNNRQRNDNVRAMNKLAQQRYRERQRQKNDFQQNKLGEYAETVQKLEQVQLDNQQLEDEHKRLQAELNKLEDITPSAPTLSNGSTDSDSNHSSTDTFTARTQRIIRVEPAHAVAYRKTEQAWFAKIDELRASMESLGFWQHGGPHGSATAELSQERMMKLGGALQGVVELCCKVANMEGLEMNTLLKRTYETCSNINSWKDPDRWRTAAQDLKLSVEQKHEFMTLRRRCLEELKTLYGKRQDLSTRLVESLLPSDGVAHTDPSSDPKSLDAITVQLEENLKEEQRFNCQMLYTVFRYCLSPIQAGWVILQSFPEHVDVLAFMNAVEDVYGSVGHNGRA